MKVNEVCLPTADIEKFVNATRLGSIEAAWELHASNSGHRSWSGEEGGADRRCPRSRIEDRWSFFLGRLHFVVGCDAWGTKPDGFGSNLEHYPNPRKRTIAQCPYYSSAMPLLGNSPRNIRHSRTSLSPKRSPNLGKKPLGLEEGSRLTLNKTNFHSQSSLLQELLRALLAEAIGTGMIVSWMANTPDVRHY